MNHASPRVSRSFVPASSREARLESIVLLSAAEIAAELAVVADSKAQYDSDLAVFKADYGIYQQQVIINQNGYILYNQGVTLLKMDVRDYNDTYHPNMASFKQTTAVGLDGKPQPQLSVEIDLGAVFKRVRPGEVAAAQAAADILTARGKTLQGKLTELDAASKDLSAQDQIFQARNAALVRRAAALKTAETNIQEEEFGQGLEVTYFDDSDLSDIPVPDGFEMVDASFDDEYDNGDFWNYYT